MLSAENICVYEEKRLLRFLGKASLWIESHGFEKEE